MRDAVAVARDCLGKVLVHGKTAGRIVEVEAYLGVNDRAAHSWRGITNRTRVMFGPPGHAYVYFIYGMHECLNFVCEPEGLAGCVLIRALEPLAGIALMERRRATKKIENLTSGPGKLTQAMAITRKHNGSSLITGPICVRGFLDEEAAFEIGVSPRIGIRHCADWPLRFFVQGNRCVSK